MLICPHCQQALTADSQQYRCQNNHAFDVGRAGDVNLLLPNQKRSKNPGDSKAMVAARRDFLASGVYQPMAEMLAKTVTIVGQGEPKVIADAGCGEGYYLRQIQRLCYPNVGYFTQNGGAFIGWDISKFAVQSAAKQANQQADFSATWVTASNAAIPLASDSVDVLLSAFGFEVAGEFARVVKSGGYVVTLDVGEQHLIELRQLIYPTLKPYQAKPLLSQSVMSLIKTETLSYNVGVNHQQLQQLMLMTPHFYRATAEAKNQLNNLSQLSVTVNVILRIYRCV